MTPFTELHRLLGIGPCEFSTEMIDNAIELRIEESGALDWKTQLSPKAKLQLTDFPKDIAAMANSGGGIIV